MKATTGMLHRHLNHSQFTLASIDDVISRGGWDAWIRLRAAVGGDEAIREKVLRVCRARMEDPGEQRYYLWYLYAQKR
jgi:hypothetical protein